MARLAGKVAIVTGGAQGLGRADCEALAREGARVVITDVKVAEGQAVADALNSTRAGSALFLQQDVRDEERWREVIARTVAHFGGLHVLVNNAGIVIPGTPEATTLEEFRLQNAIMCEGVFLGCKHAIPAMRGSGGGSIVNISDVAGLRPWARYPIHSISKAGIEMLTQVAALALAPDIRVNAVAPGPVLRPERMSAERWRSLGSRLPLQRTGTPDDITQAVLFLLRNDFMTGETITVDGGDRLT